MMRVNEESVLLLKYARQLSGSDLAAYGVVEPNTRRLSWLEADGGQSPKTGLISQKGSGGLSGAALRSGRPSRSGKAMSDSERFKLGEAIVMTERLREAVAFPILTTASGKQAVVLIGIRSGESFAEERLQAVERAIADMADRL